MNQQQAVTAGSLKSVFLVSTTVNVCSKNHECPLFDVLDSSSSKSKRGKTYKTNVLAS